MKYISPVSLGWLTGLLIYLLVGCEGAYPKETDKKIIDGYQFEIVEYDACEYLFYPRGNAAMITHKGNCKYCAVRSKITSQFPQGVDSIKFVGNTFEVFKSGKKYTVEL